jgi:hypothetical protein
VRLAYCLQCDLRHISAGRKEAACVCDTECNHKTRTMIRTETFEQGNKLMAQTQTSSAPEAKVVFWHRELPPLDGEPLGEHVVEATSSRIRNTLAHREELWKQCYAGLVSNAQARLEQEVTRLGGDYAHVLDESVDSRHDDVTGEAWLYGRYVYVLYQRKNRRQK